MEELSMYMLNDNILVTELTDDLMLNGVVTIYDSDNPYMFGEVKDVANEIDNIEVGDIVVIKRYAKEEFLPGYYFISNKDIRCKMPKEEYEKLLVN